MGEVEAKFSCDGCGKTYKWKPEFAGRKVKCKCGFVMTAPAAPAAPPDEDEPDLDALYTLADQGHQAAKAGVTTASIRCPSCRSEVEPGASVCTQCGFNLKTGKKVAAPKAGAPVGAAVATAGGPAPAGGAFGFPGARRGLQQESVGENQVLDLYIPLGMLAFGIFGLFAQYMWFGRTLHPFAGAIPWVAVDVVVSCVVLAIGCLVAIQALDVALGSPGTAALKVAAIALAPSAVAGFIGYAIGGSVGMWIGFLFFIVVYFASFHYLFDMDMGEVLILSGLLFFVRIVAVIFLVPLVMGIFIASNAAGLTAADKTMLNDDKVVEDMNESRPTDDAAGWLNDSTNRMFADVGHDQSVKLVSDLMSVGCSKVTVIAQKGEPQTPSLWCKLPRDSNKRKQAFDIANQFAKDHKISPKTDAGQTYLLIQDKFSAY